MADYRYIICDVFTDEPLTGNQLAVFPAAEGIPEAQLQALAREINFAETVFAYAGGQGAEARVRIFTPRTELAFAGHPVLGSAFVLAGDRAAVALRTGAGVVRVDLERDRGRVVFGRMRQPLPRIESLHGTDELLAALGVEASRLPVECYDNGVRHVFVALDDEDAVATLQPDLATLARISPDAGVNCFSGDGARWRTRMFWPGAGVAEDPATGSAAGPLAVHLARHGRVPFGTQVAISQGQEIGRPSLLYARAVGSAEHLDHVEVGGSAVVVGRGEFSFA